MLMMASRDTHRLTSVIIVSAENAQSAMRHIYPSFVSAKQRGLSSCVSADMRRTTNNSIVGYFLTMITTKKMFTISELGDMIRAGNIELFEVFVRKCTKRTFDYSDIIPLAILDKRLPPIFMKYALSSTVEVCMDSRVVYDVFAPYLYEAKMYKVLYKYRGSYWAVKALSSAEMTDENRSLWRRVVNYIPLDKFIERLNDYQPIDILCLTDIEKIKLAWSSKTMQDKVRSLPNYINTRFLPAYLDTSYEVYEYLLSIGVDISNIALNSTDVRVSRKSLSRLSSEEIERYPITIQTWIHGVDIIGKICPQKFDRGIHGIRCMYEHHIGNHDYLSHAPDDIVGCSVRVVEKIEDDGANDYIRYNDHYKIFINRLRGKDHTISDAVMMLMNGKIAYLQVLSGIINGIAEFTMDRARFLNRRYQPWYHVVLDWGIDGEWEMTKFHPIPPPKNIRVLADVVFIFDR